MNAERVDIINLPDSVRRTEECRFRIGGRCFNSVNYLRPWECTEYCIAKLDDWVRRHEPELDDEQVHARVYELASGSSVPKADSSESTD